MKSSHVATGFLVLLFCSTALSQSLKIGVGGGTEFIQSPDGFMSDISHGGLGFGTSYSIGGKARFSVPAVPVSVVGHVSYVFMSGSGSYNNSAVLPQIQGSIETRSHLLSIGVGGEWTVLQGPVAPYLGAGFLISSLGQVGWKVTNATGTTEYLSGGGTRYGIGLGAGTRFPLAPTIDLDVNGEYNFNSLFGKSAFETDLNTIDIKAYILFTIL